MPEQVKKVIDPIKARWDILTPPQRYKLLGVIAVVLVALILTLYLAFRTQWTYIVYRRSWHEVTAMAAALDDAGIRNQIVDDGRGLRVPTNLRVEARSAIVTSGAAPNDHHFTWADAHNTGLGTTDDERRSLQIRGAEGAIERLLTDQHGISDARASLAIPAARPFDRNATMPSASVTITTTNDFAATGRSLALQVAHAVVDLHIEEIIIIDQWGRTIWDGTEEFGDDLVGSVAAAQEQFRNINTGGVMSLMAMGFDEVAAHFTPVFDSTIFTETDFRQWGIPEGMEDTGIPFLTETRRAGYEGMGGGWEPGLANNMAIGPGYAAAGPGNLSAWEREELIHSRVNEIHTVTQQGPSGMIPGDSTLAVTVVAHNHISQERWLAEDETRTLADWEMFKANNAIPIMLNSTFEGFYDWQSHAARAVGIPAENVDLVILQRNIFHDLEVTGWDIPTILMVAVLLLLMAMLIYGLLRKQRAAGEDEESLEPQLAVEDLLVSTQLEEAREEAREELEEIDYFKENEVKRHIEKFVNEKPEAVAALLRNWINVEEW